MKTGINKEDGENIDKKRIKLFWNWFLKQSKEKKWNDERKLITTNY